MLRYSLIYLGFSISLLLMLNNSNFNLSNNIQLVSTVFYVLFLGYDILKKKLILTTRIFNKLTDFILLFIMLPCIFIFKELNTIVLLVFLSCHLLKIFTAVSNNHKTTFNN